MELSQADRIKINGLIWLSTVAKKLLVLQQFKTWKKSLVINRRGGVGERFLVTRARVAAGCWKGYGPLATRAGRSAQQSFIWRGSAPGSAPLPFYIPFLTVKVPLLYTFYWQMIPLSHTYVAWNFVSPLTAKNALRFKYEYITSFCNIFTFLLYRLKWQISLPFYILQQVKSLSFHIPEVTPFGRSLTVYGYYRVYLQPRAFSIALSLK